MNVARSRTNNYTASSLFRGATSRTRFTPSATTSVLFGSNLTMATSTTQAATINSTNNNISKRCLSSATLHSNWVHGRSGSSIAPASSSFATQSPMLKRGVPATLVVPPSAMQVPNINRGIASLLFKKNIFGDNTTNNTNRDPTSLATNVEAAFQRGKKYHHGLGVDQNLEIALESYQQAAYEGHAESCCALASMYAKGEVAGWADYEKARQLYSIAALLGNAHAQYKLGEMYESGIGVGVDLLKAQHWYIEAGKRNYAPALCSLGTMYAEGEGVEYDPGRAFQLLQAAADQGLADAQCCLGLMYLNGEGTEPDEAMAEEYYMRAAEQGHALAQVNLGHLYYNQDNAEMAKECWELAAKQGVALALCNLGAMYMTGQGVPQSYSKAYEYYSQAAHKGDFEAQYQMGLLYEHGYGVQQQPNTALSWFNKAAQQGHTEAKECVSRLRSMWPMAADSSSSSSPSTTNVSSSASSSSSSTAEQSTVSNTVSDPQAVSSGGKGRV